MADFDHWKIEDVLKVSEVRRPGLTEMFKTMRRKYPTWRDDTILAKAKTKWHAANQQETQ